MPSKKELLTDAEDVFIANHDDQGKQNNTQNLDVSLLDPLKLHNIEQAKSHHVKQLMKAESVAEQRLLDPKQSQDS